MPASRIELLSKAYESFVLTIELRRQVRNRIRISHILIFSERRRMFSYADDVQFITALSLKIKQLLKAKFEKQFCHAATWAKTASWGGHCFYVVAGAGIEPTPSGYEPDEVPLLHPAMYCYFITLLVFPSGSWGYPEGEVPLLHPATSLIFFRLFFGSSGSWVYLWKWGSANPSHHSFYSFIIL